MAGVDPPLYKDWLQSKDLKFHWANKNETYVLDAAYEMAGDSVFFDEEEAPLLENDYFIEKRNDSGPYSFNLRTVSAVAPMSKVTFGILYKWASTTTWPDGDNYIWLSQGGFHPGGWGVAFNKSSNINLVCDHPQINSVTGIKVPIGEWFWLVASVDYGNEIKVYLDGVLGKTFNASSCTPRVTDAQVEIINAGGGGLANQYEFSIANFFVVEEIIPEWEIKMMWDRVVNPERQYLSAAVREAVTDSDSLLYLPLQDMPTMSSRSIRAYYNGVDVEDRDLVKSGSPAMSGWTPAGTSIGPGPTDVSAFTDG